MTKNYSNGAEEEEVVAMLSDQDPDNQHQNVGDSKADRRAEGAAESDLRTPWIGYPPVATDKEADEQSVNDSDGDDSDAAGCNDTESKIDSFLHGRCDLAIASRKRESSAREEGDKSENRKVSKCDEKRLKISLKEISTRSELAAALGIHVRAISLVMLKSSKCSTDGCNLLAAYKNSGRCILCEQTWFPREQTRQRGWGLYGRQFLRSYHSEGVWSTNPETCCCENPLCRKIGFSHEGTMGLPKNPDHGEKFLELLGIASRERREEMARSAPKFRKRFRISPWHFRPEHRERRASGRWNKENWRLIKMNRYKDADGNVRPFAPPDGDLQQFIDYEIPGAFRMHDDALPGWAAKLARMQEGVAGPGDVETINEGTPTFPPLPSPCKVDEDDAGTPESQEEEKPSATEKDKESNSQQPTLSPQSYWERMFFHLALHRATNDGSFDGSFDGPKAKRHCVDLPGLPSATLGDFVHNMRQYKRLLQIRENNEGSTLPEENEKYAQYFSAAESILTPDRIKALESIGFSWEEPPPRWHAVWEERYKELAKHHAEHGDYEPKNNRLLLNWCYTQRQHINKAMEGMEKMSEGAKEFWGERKAKLDELGFVWRKTAPHISWEERLEALKRFKEEHGHCNVGKYHHPSLGRWVNRMRNDYRDKIEGKKSLLTKERILLLESIGFKWQLKKRHSKKTDPLCDEEEVDE